MRGGLALQGVTKRYGDRTVLDGVSVSVAAHEVLTLIGASGSGKSTLLRCVNRLEDIQGGRILLGGDVISGPGVAENALRRRIGIVFQAYNLFPHLTAEQNVALAPRKVLGLSRRDARDAAVAALDRVGLADRAGAYPDQLSGGQQQRVALGRALAMRPAVLLLDEITSALDPLLVTEVLDLVRGLAADGVTMVIATHELAFARDVSHTVAYLRDGRLIEVGPPEQVFDHPREPATAAFVGRLPRRVGGIPLEAKT